MVISDGPCLFLYKNYTLLFLQYRQQCGKSCCCGFCGINHLLSFNKIYYIQMLLPDCKINKVQSTLKQNQPGILFLLRKSSNQSSCLEIPNFKISCWWRLIFVGWNQKQIQKRFYESAQFFQRQNTESKMILTVLIAGSHLYQRWVTTTTVTIS